MDSNWNSSSQPGAAAAAAAAGGGPAPGGGDANNASSLDWRVQLQPDARQRIVNKIMDTLKRHLPVPVPEGLSELQKIAVRFEEKIYSAATSQPDYLRKISLKMLSMETKTQPGGMNAPAPLANQNRIDPGVGMTTQQPVTNPGQSLGMQQTMNQAPASRQQQQQQLLQGSPNIPSALPGGPSGATIPQMPGPSISNSNPMSGSAGTNGPGGPTGTLPTDMYSNPQRRQQPQQLTSQNQIMYHQQQLAMRQKMQQQQQQQQQQLQQTQMQMSSALAGGTGMMSTASTGGMQQSQLNSVQQQPVGQGGSFQQQNLMRQQQQQPQATMQNSTIPMQQTNNVPDLQQQRLQMQQNQMQQNQMQQNQVQQNQVQQVQQNQMQQSQMQQSQMQQSQMQQSQMQQNQMQQSQLQQSQLQQNQMQQSQLQQNQLQQNQLQPNQMQPNQMQQNQMLNQKMLLGQQQNQMMGSAGGSMNNMQRQMQMQRQAGPLQQQQPQQQQHLLSQLQPQQQQLPQQQQPSMMQQRDMQMQQQQRMQGPAALLQTQNGTAIDPQRQQQQQFISQQQQPQQQQRGIPDVASSPASMDSTAQTGNTGDWQEEIYQKLKYLKETYLADLRDIHQKLSNKLSQLDNVVLANARGGDQVEKMKQFKLVLERMMAVLQLGKQGLNIGLKDKLALYEKQILSILQNHKKAPQPQVHSGASSDQQQFSSLQQSQPGMQSQQPPLQQQSQQIDNHPNQLQQQLNSSAMPQSNNLGISGAMQQGMPNTLQSDQLLANSTGFGSVQQGGMGPTMQNTMNPPQMVGSGAAIGSSSMQHTINIAGMQTNMSSAQVLKQQQQHQEQQQQQQTQQRMIPTQQQIQQRQLQQQRMMHKQQIMQQVQQQKQQHPQQNQMQQLNQSNDLAEVKSRQGISGMKPGSMYQQHYPGIGPRNSYYPQLKPSSNLPISSPQNIQSSSPQISLPSPQVDQQAPVPPTLKSGTPLQAAASPFIPSPSPPVAPSPMIEDTKFNAVLMHNSGSVQPGQALPANSAQTSQMGQPQAGSLAVGTPGISASPLLAEFTSPEAGQGTNLSTQIPETEKPIEKLTRLMRTMPRNQRSASVKDIASVVSMVDRIAGSAPGNGSRAAIGDDLVAMTKCRLQAKNLVHPDGGAGASSGASPPAKKMKRDTSAMPLNNNNNDGLSSDAGGITDNFKASIPSEMQSTAISNTKRLKSEMHHALLEELREINIRLIDTELTLSEEDTDLTAEAGEGIVVKCTYKAIALSPGLKAHFTSSHLSPILPLRLLVPAGYPECSPVILDKLLDERRDIDDFSARARSKFNIYIRGLSQPMSLKEIAHTWDSCARMVIQEYAVQFGGGSFSSRMIKWRTVNPEEAFVVV